MRGISQAEPSNCVGDICHLTMRYVMRRGYWPARNVNPPVSFAISGMFALKIYRRHRAIREFQLVRQEVLRGPDDEGHLAEECLEFDPPAYRQRYAAVQQVLLDQRWRKEIRRIVDFGCSELGFFQYMKHLFGVTEILEVDIDADVLEQYRYRIQPLTADYLKQRTEPLVVKILCGSVAHPDPVLGGVDAVVAIELIEHLYPDTLESLPHNVFGFIKPRVAIFTTPNADFNILFPNFKGFRHYDHKFEWTRQQFEDWAHNITVRYPQYSVYFEGVAKGPRGTESLGCCSQMAVFVKEYSTVNVEVHLPHDRTRAEALDSFGVCAYFSYTKQLSALSKIADCAPCDSDESRHCYKLISTATYPYKVDGRTPEEKILHEAMYSIYRNANADSRFFNEEENVVEIPLSEIIGNFDGLFVSEQEIRKILVRADFTVRECVLSGLDEACLCVVYDINMDEHSSPPVSECDKSEHEVDCNVNDSDSDWEQEYEPSENRCSAAVGAVAPKNEETASSPLSNAEPSEQLFDSGYQKSISNAEWSPQSPMDGTFEEQFSGYLKLDVNDIKETVKAGNPDPTTKQVNNRLTSERKNFAGSSRKSPQKELEPGTSDPKKKKRPKRPTSGSDEDVDDELRTLADCIVYNSLNRLNVEDEAPSPERIVAPAVERAHEGVPYVVENGDLANNNRDDEGNNYPDDVPVPAPFVVDDEDNANEFREIEDNADVAPAPVMNQDQENRNDIVEAAAGPNLAAALIPLADYDDDESDAAATTVDTTDMEDSLLNHASREALFDPDSQLDMLDEYPLAEAVRQAEENPVEVVAVENDVVIPEHVNPFPNWLLQLLGQPGAEDEGNNDEPHFYCQGDGLGVHPSIIEVDVDDSSSDSTSNDDAQAEQTISEDEVGSLPVDASGAEQPMLVVVGQALTGQPAAPAALRALPVRPSPSVLSNDSNEEFFDTIDDSEPSCPGTDKK